MSSATDWSKAFARQAQADLDTRDRLQRDAAIPECHKLLFLQMACEKLVKAHLCRAGADPQDLQQSHAYVAKNLPVVIRQQLGGAKNAGWLVQHAKHLSREIEFLCPAVRRGGQRKDNCESPWEDGGRLCSPLEWNFVPSRLLTEPAGRTVLKLVRDAIRRNL